MDLREFYLKQLVTQGEMDDFEAQIARAQGMLLGRGFGVNDGIASNIRGPSVVGSIVDGGQVVPAAAPDKTVRGDYLLAYASVEDFGGVHTPYYYSDGMNLPTPMLCHLGSQGTALGFDAWTHDFTSIIGAITSGQFVRCRMYAVTARVESDPRVDGDGNPLNYKRDIGMEIQVDVGVEAASAGAAVLPPLREDHKSVHLAEIGALTDTTTTITTTEIWNTERDYNGLTLLSGTEQASRRMIEVLDVIDPAQVYTDGTKTQRLITLTHNKGYDPGATSIQDADSWVMTGRSAVWKMRCTTADNANPRRTGLRRDWIVAKMRFMVTDGGAPGLAIAGVSIVPLGMSTDAGGEQHSMLANSVNFRYLVHNNSGVSISVGVLCEMWLFDMRVKKLINF